MNSKASVQDVGWAMVIFFVAVIAFVSVTYTYSTFVDKATNLSVVNASSAAVTSFRETKALTGRLDYVAFVLLIGFILFIIITGWLVGGHPIFMFFYALVLFIFIAVSAGLSYAWNKVSTTTIFANTVIDKFPIANHILSNFPTYITIIGFLGMFVMFAKPYLIGSENQYE